MPFINKSFSKLQFYQFTKQHTKNLLRRSLSKKTIRRMKILLAYFNLFIDIPLLTIKIYFTHLRATVLLCLDSPASIGGTELQLLLIAEELQKKGLQPLVIITGSLPTQRTSDFFLRLKQIGGIKHLHLRGVGLIKHVLFEKYKMMIFKKLQASICHCFNPLSTLLISSAKKAGLKILYSETGLPCKNEVWEPLFPYIHLIDSVVSVSKAGILKLQNELGYKGPALVVHSLIEPPPFQLRARCPVLGELKIVYFGHMHVHKGVWILFRAFQKLLSIYPHAYLTFIGEGALRQPLERQIKHTVLEKHIFFSNFKKKEDLYKELSNFDLMCLPSFSEGAPCSILEAMSIGLAVVATDVGGISELIEEKISGLLVPPHNELALARALIRFALNPFFRFQTAENGRHRFHNYFAPKQLTSKILSIYNKPLSNLKIRQF